MARLRRADGAGSLGENVRNTLLRFDLPLQPGLIVARQQTSWSTSSPDRFFLAAFWT